MFFAMTKRNSFEVNQNRQKSNKVDKIMFQLNDNVLWSLYVFILFFLDSASRSSGNAFVSVTRGLRFNSRSVKSNSVLPTACYHCNISSKGAVLLGRNDAEMCPANSLHALVYCSNYNEKFYLMIFFN